MLGNAQGKRRKLLEKRPVLLFGRVADGRVNAVLRG
jgi:hypothetical protein